MKSEIRKHCYPALFALCLQATTSSIDAKTVQGNNPLQRQLQVDDSSVSCSPLIINFVLSLTQSCQDSNLRQKSGIKDTLCIVEKISDNGGDDDDVSPSSLPRLDVFDPLGIQIGDSLNWFPSEEDRILQNDDMSMVPVEITSIQFLEMDDSGDLKVINQDDSMINVNLVDGQMVQFTSITSTLDPDVPLDDQRSLVPGGAVLVVVGVNAAGEAVRNRLQWIYSNTCETEPCTKEDVPIDPGDKIGWVTFGESEQAQPNFCDALTESPTASPTELPTASPVMTPPTRIAPTTTLAPTMEVPPIGGLPTPSEMSMSTKSAKKAKSSKSTKSSKSGSKAKKSGKVEMEIDTSGREDPPIINMDMDMGMYGGRVA